MNLRHGATRVLVLVVVVSMPLLGLSGIASAKSTVGSPAWCAAHPKKALHTVGCSTYTGKSGGTDPPAMTVQVDPTPLIETATSAIAAVIQVETSASFAGDSVNISSSQLSATCSGGVYFYTLQGTTGNAFTPVPTTIAPILDDDGNVTVTVSGVDCAPGDDVIEADLTVAPYYTALGTLEASAPITTTAGVTGYPQTSGIITTGEVETGDTPTSGDSDVYAIFYVEDNPVYAEQTVEISSAQLEGRCVTGWSWASFDAPPVTGIGVNKLPPETSVLDDDGNAIFAFFGSSCAAGPSQVIADVMAGSHDTFTTVFNIVAPAPTI
jgi:hypothetical protein